MCLGFSSGSMCVGLFVNIGFIQIPDFGLNDKPFNFLAFVSSPVF